MSTCSAISISVSISMMPMMPSIGRDLFLMCVVSGEERLNPQRVYRWFRAGTNEPLQTGPNLTFSPLTLNDAGEYTCEATVISDEVALNLTKSVSHAIHVTSKAVHNICMHGDFIQF